MLQKKDPLNLTGKVAVVTGGSSGIGLGVVELLSAYGAKVAMVDISPKGADKAKELQDAGREVEFFQCDVTSEASVMAAVKAIVDRWGALFLRSPAQLVGGRWQTMPGKRGGREL